MGDREEATFGVGRRFGAQSDQAGSTAKLEHWASWKRRLPLLVVAVVMTVGIGFAVPSAFVVHDEDLFELDGNTANDPAVLGDDWSNYQSAGTPSRPCS